MKRNHKKGRKGKKQEEIEVLRQSMLNAFTVCPGDKADARKWTIKNQEEMVNGDHTTSPTYKMNGIEAKADEWAHVPEKPGGRVRKNKVSYPTIVEADLFSYKACSLKHFCFLDYSCNYAVRSKSETFIRRS